MSEIGVDAIGKASGPKQDTMAGMSKAWWSFDGTAGTIAIAQSFNVSSLTDNGVGDYDVNLTGAMANTEAVVTVAGNRNSASAVAHGLNKTTMSSASVVNTNTGDTNGSTVDWDQVGNAIFGDLAP